MREGLLSLETVDQAVWRRSGQPCLMGYLQMGRDQLPLEAQTMAWASPPHEGPQPERNLNPAGKIAGFTHDGDVCGLG